MLFAAGKGLSSMLFVKNKVYEMTKNKVKLCK